MSKRVKKFLARVEELARELPEREDPKKTREIISLLKGLKKQALQTGKKIVIDASLGKSNPSFSRLTITPSSMLSFWWKKNPEAESGVESSLSLEEAVKGLKRGEHLLLREVLYKILKEEQADIYFW